MSDLGFRDHETPQSNSDGIASLKGALAAFILVSVGTVALVIAPLIGHGSLLSFVVGGAVFFAGIVGFVEILKRSGDRRD